MKHFTKGQGLLSKKHFIYPDDIIIETDNQIIKNYLNISSVIKFHSLEFKSHEADCGLRIIRG